MPGKRSRGGSGEQEQWTTGGLWTVSSGTLNGLRPVECYSEGKVRLKKECVGEKQQKETTRQEESEEHNSQNDP